jgi:hypothetical protein
VRAEVVLTVDRTGTDLAQLPKGLALDRRLHPDLGADGGTIRDCAHKLEHDPMIGVAIVLKETVLYVAAHGEVEEAIVVEITPCRAP